MNKIPTLLSSYPWYSSAGVTQQHRWGSESSECCGSSLSSLSSASSASSAEAVNEIWDTLHASHCKLHASHCKVYDREILYRQNMHEQLDTHESANRHLRARLQRREQENEALQQEVKQLREENTQLKSVVESVEQRSPMCFVNHKGHPCRISWVVDNVHEEKKCRKRGSSIFSPEGLPFDFEFYPQGSLNAPAQCCSLAVFSERERRLAFRLFVGSKITELIEMTFTKHINEYMRHFRGLSEEIGANGSVEVGMEIVENEQTIKYIIY